MTQEKDDLRDAIGGGFAFMTAPFAVHPLDKRRAKETVKLAREMGVADQEFIALARNYLETAQGWPSNIEEQLDRVRKFIKGKL